MQEARSPSAPRSWQGAAAPDRPETRNSRSPQLGLKAGTLRRRGMSARRCGAVSDRGWHRAEPAPERRPPRYQRPAPAARAAHWLSASRRRSDWPARPQPRPPRVCPPPARGCGCGHGSGRRGSELSFWGEKRVGEESKGEKTVALLMVTAKKPLRRRAASLYPRSGSGARA